MGLAASAPVGLDHTYLSHGEQKKFPMTDTVPQYSKRSRDE
jgi:hypothetical protein